MYCIGLIWVGPCGWALQEDITKYGDIWVQTSGLKLRRSKLLLLYLNLIINYCLYLLLHEIMLHKICIFL